VNDPVAIFCVLFACGLLPHRGARRAPAEDGLLRIEELEGAIRHHLANRAKGGPGVEARLRAALADVNGTGERFRASLSERERSDG
jgi:hypothetical protein